MRNLRLLFFSHGFLAQPPAQRRLVKPQQNLIACARLGLLLLLVIGQASGLAAQRLDKAVLLQAVGRVPLPSQPDALCTIISLTEQPEIILTAEVNPDNLSQSFQLVALASSRLGKGKLLAFSTPAYFRRPLVQEGEVQKLLTNCLNWGSQARRKRVQVWGGDDALRAFLARQAQVKVIGTATTLDPSADILLLNQEVADTALISRIEEFIRRGGTLLYGSPLPDLPSPNKRNSRAETGFNQLLLKAGLLQTNAITIKYPHRAFLSADSIPQYVGIHNILQSVRTNTYQPLSPLQGGYLFAYTLEQAFALNPADSPMGRRLRGVLHHWPDSLIIPTAEKPVRLGENYSAYLAQHLLLESQLRDHPDPTYVAPAAATFPGAVPATAPRVTTDLVLPVRVGSNGVWEPAPGYRWPHSTGLYVPAGEKVILYLTAADSLRQLVAQIGVHKNELTHLPQFSREGFNLTRTFALKHGRTEIYSPYGGLLLLNIPDTSSLQTLRLKVVGAVQAPRFELGKTSVAAWQQTIRHYPAPWAELLSNNVSLIVPAARIRTLNDPEKVVAFWDAALATDAKLAGLTTARRHPERLIVDQEVAYGYMFTDTDRIVVPDDESCQHMLDAQLMWSTGSWGHFHELGHRHQFWNIDFKGLQEISVNLYTLYVFDKLLHKGLYNHPQIESRQAVANKVRAYLANSPSFEKWQANPFVALCLYIQLIDAFGWGPMEQVYQRYRQLPRSQYPATEAAKLDYWFAAICAATHRDLSSFFAQWRVPISKEAQGAAAAYPSWLPLEMQSN